MIIPDVKLQAMGAALIIKRNAANLLREAQYSNDDYSCIGFAHKELVTACRNYVDAYGSVDLDPIPSTDEDE